MNNSKLFVEKLKDNEVKKEDDHVFLDKYTVEKQTLHKGLFH